MPRQTHDKNSTTSFMLASPLFASSSRKKKSYLDVGRRKSNTDSKERIERRDLIKRSLHADHMIGDDDDDDDDDYLSKQLQVASSHSQPTGPTVSRRSSYLDVGRRNSNTDSKERIQRRDLIKRSLHADHMIGDDADDDDDDYLSKQLQVASSHFQPTGSTVSRRGSSSSRKDSRRESTSSVNSARSHSDALVRQIQLASSHSRVSRSSSSSSKRDSRRERSSSVNSVRSHSDAHARRIDGILSSPYIENRRRHRSKSTDPIAQSVTTIPKTTTSRRHSSGKGDDAKALPPITLPNERPRRRFSLPSSLRSHSKQDSQNAVRDKEVEVPSPPPLTTRRRSGPLSPQLTLRKKIRTPRTTSSSRSNSLSRSNHSLSRSNHSAEASSSRLSRRVSPRSVIKRSPLSRQPDTIGASMTSLSAHLSKKSYTSDSDDDDDESILSTIFRTVGEVYDDCLSVQSPQ